MRDRLDADFAEGLRALLPPGAPCLVAVSGGRDSMALLHFLRSHGWERLHVAHYDHGLRGEQSAADAAFVAEAARGMGLPFDVAQAGPGVLEAASDGSLEAAAREARYAWLGEVSERISGESGGVPVPVVTAHHADDQAETVLIHLCRGAGSRGLSGMAPRSRIRAGGREVEIVRPLLPVPRREIERYAEACGLRWREDLSNADPRFLRNRVRQRLLPAMEEVFGRDVRPALWRAAELARLDEAWAAEAEGELPRRGEGLELAALREMPAARRGRLLLRWLRESEVPDCGYAEVTRIDEVVLSRGHPARANLPGGWTARRRAGVLFLERSA